MPTKGSRESESNVAPERRWWRGAMEVEPMEEDVAMAGARLVPHAETTTTTQGEVLVVLEVNKDICTHALNWAFHHVVRRGDTLRLVGILSHVLNPMGYKCRLDENSWLGANRRILESELANKLHMLHHIDDLDLCCQKAGVQMVVEVKAGLHPKMIVVEEAKKCNAYHVVLDRTMKKDKKYFVDNLTCFVTRVKNSGGVDSIRSFAISNPLSLPGSRNSSLNSSLRGTSMSSTKYNHVDPKEFNDNQWNSWRSITGSSGTTTKRSSFEIGRSSCDELLFPGLGPPPGSEPSTTDNEMAFEWSKTRQLDLALATSCGDAVLPLAKAQSCREPMPKTNAFFARSISEGDRVASGRIGVREKAAKTAWVWTSSKDVMLSAVAVGWTTFVFTPDTKDLADDWTTLARIRPLYMEECQIVDSQNRQVAAVGQFTSSEQLEHLPSVMGRADVVVMNAPDSQWSLIQAAAAERMVTAFQDSSTALYAVANSASDSQIYLEALGKGTDGVVLHTDDPAQIYALKGYLRGRREATMGVRMVKATVTQVEPVGLGDRVCVDLCNLLQPGEGLLVGSFARALFLVHSDWSDIDHTASRPFRVNAGPVHAYVGMAGGVTSYLSELHTGSQVMVVNAQGQSRTVLVGRVKIESRPLLLVEVEVEGEGQRHSVLLQNSENVCLVTPGEGMTGHPVPVTSLKIGHSLLINLQDEESDSGNEMIQTHVVEK